MVIPLFHLKIKCFLFMKNNLISTLSFYLALFVIVLVFGLSYFIYDISLLSSVISMGISFLFTFFFSFYLLSSKIKKNIIEKVSAVYNNLFPTTISSRSTDNFDLLTSNLKKITNEKNTEIELLKQQENWQSYNGTSVKQMRICLLLNDMLVWKTTNHNK